MADTFELNSTISGPSSSFQHTTVPPKRVQKKGRILKILIVLLSLILVGESVYYLFIVPAITTAKLHFSTTGTLTITDMERHLGPALSAKWLYLDTRLLSQRLAAHPAVAEVRISKKFPDKVFIQVSERTPVATLLVSTEKQTIPMEIDKTGTVFRFAEQKPLHGLPVISGLAFKEPRIGMKVHKQLVPLFRQLDILLKNNSALLNEISEMKIEQKKYGGFDLIIYPVQTKVKVRTDSTLNEERLRYMMLTLDVVQELGLQSKIEELDVRGGTASYRLKGGIHE